MRTNDEILERYLSLESGDIFDAQKTVLLCMLPYEMAKPYIDPIYIEKTEKGELPEDEMWKDSWDVRAEIIKYIPWLREVATTSSSLDIAVGFLSLRSFLWAEDASFYDVIEDLFDFEDKAEMNLLLDKVSEHYGIEPTITDVPFEELSEESIDPDLGS